jgi:hypothetical protein
MGHVADGVLRRYLDEPAAVSDVARRHIEACARCDGELRRAAEDRAIAGQALGAPDIGSVGDGVDLDLAWARLSARLDEPVAGEPLAPMLAVQRTGRRWARHQVAAGVTAGLLVLGGAAVAAAANWVPIFRTQSVAPVAVSTQDLASLSALGDFSALASYGNLEASPTQGPIQVTDATVAQDRTGLRVPTVDALPSGVEGAPSYFVVDRQTATFTFSAVKAERAATARRQAAPPMPAGLDGSSVRIVGGPGVAAVWTQPGGTPSLVLSRLNAPTASSEGVPLAVVRDYLLSFPGIPPSLAAKLRTVTETGTVLPIPVLQEEMKSSQATINSAVATVLEARSGIASAVVWVSNGELNVVAGPLSREEVVAAARGLR